MVTRNKTKSNIQDTVSFVENLKKQWMATIDAMVDPLMIIGTDYTIKKCNKAAADVAQMNVKQLINKKCHEIFANQTKPCKGCLLEQTASENKHHTFELKNVKNESYYEVSSKPFYDPNGKVDGIIHVYRDRTVAKNLENQLLQSEKLASIGLLAGGVAHEINNPLGGILIFSQMLLKEMSKDSPHYADVVEIEAATQRCKVIVERLLDFARAASWSRR
ncbi:MAG: PAS domain-containing protein [Bdellovibrionota bacterium]